MKRPVTMSLMTSMAVLTIACGTGLGLGTGVQAQEIDGEVSFAWWGSEGRNRAVYGMIKSFEETYPEAKILPQPTDFLRHWDRVTVQAAAGHLPCVPMMQTRYQTRYENLGVLLPLDDLIKEGKIDISAIPEDVVEGHRNADGNLYVLPVGLWFETFQYNWPKLEPTGVKEPANDWTYEDYIEWAAEARQKLEDEDIYPLTQLGGEILQFQQYAQGRGEDLFDGDKPGFRTETLADWFELWNRAREERLTPNMAMSAEEPSATVQSFMAQGITLSRTGGDITASELQSALDAVDGGFALQVKPPNGNNPLTSGSNSLSISANCDNVDASAAFVDFWLNDKDAGVEMQSRVGLTPTVTLLDAQVVDPASPPTLVDRIKMYKGFADTYGVNIDVWPDNTQHLINEFTNLYEQVGFGQMEAEEAANLFVEDVQRALNEG
ncbi:ABC transporter substrate-binding protein [Hoeflea prorocentri]|uniref:Extracellular solute-binding protein n=1 Tax=Hoeflea prorocentri TaxID=1922333 RepID=A0A9X3UJP1_9HYPH|nr:extracellular solute-binding protein [Hoeflea prorocentri]MCY6381894.1 extracellular solute-binding protein [Hoeflea prorocentri]MDA5399694.1 extracellular solute-binding protein [Hoeflea prorocentri]